MNIRRASNGGAVTRGLAPGEKKKKKARKEGRHIHIPGGAERRERNEKKKKLSLLFGVKDATTCNAASQC